MKKINSLQILLRNILGQWILKIEDLKVVLDMYMSDQDEERATEKNRQEGEER